MSGFYKSLLFEPPEDVINCSFAYEQTFGFTKLPLYFVAIHPSVAYVVEDIKHENAFSSLICPVI